MSRVSLKLSRIFSRIATLLELILVSICLVRSASLTHWGFPARRMNLLSCLVDSCRV